MIGKEAAKEYKLTSEQSMLFVVDIFSIDKKNANKELFLPIYFLDRGSDASLEAMEKAFNRLIEYNDALRLSIHLTFKGPRQRITEYSYEHLPIVPLDSLDAFDKEKHKVFEDKLSFFGRKLYNARLYSVCDNGCGIIMNFHHAVVDGYSVSLIMERFESYYSAYKNNEALSNDEIKYSIIPFFESVAKYKKSQKYKNDFRYWFRSLNNQPGFSVPTGKRTFQGFSSQIQYDFDYTKFSDLKNKLGCSSQSLVVAVAALTTYFLSNQKVFVISILTHGRMNISMKKTIGDMANIFQVFFNINPEENVKTFLINTYKGLLESLSHGRFPWMKQMIFPLKYALSTKFNFAYNWLFISVVEYASHIEQSLYECDWIGSGFQSEQMYCTLLENDNGLKLDLGYQNRKFSREKIETIRSTFGKMFSLIVDNLDPRFSET